MFERIIIKAAGNKNRHSSSNEFDFGQDQTANWSYLPLSDDNFTLLKLNISEASRPVFIKFYVKYHWGWGGGRLHEVLEHWIKTLVSMAMERPH